ncbi:helix-turn-helix domain-containing protein [Streptomyces hoynatensis]|uniref:XRE family transcriptional regulator n=1 Tax=Streptomyces hoynatensis TaxID=1141874 RepID=A0A3A9YMY3_9ACTN|nr:helix-turn-helix transcriptional regulator [Streptomyces hoynatensis]RKN37631.1 XRE family transcriptional regulator [Streptomyces hoynatensis]
MDGDGSTGDTLRALRLGRGLTQEKLAEKAGLRPGVIKKIEGGGTARLETYHALARALGVRTAQLFDPAALPPDNHADDHAVDLMPLRREISPPVTLSGGLGLIDAGEAPHLVQIRDVAAALSGAYNGDDYPRVAALLPRLLTSTRLAVAFHDDGPRQREALRLRADALQMAGRFLTQVRAYDLAHVALRDAVHSAEAAGDRLAAAAAISAQGWTLLREGRLDEAESATAATAEEIEPRISRARPDELGVWGRLLRRASSAAARNNRPQEARDYLRLARTAAIALGGRPAVRLHGWNRFDGLRVGLQAIENQMVAHQPGRALGLAERVPASAASGSGNWRRHMLTVSQAHAMLRHSDEALGILAGLHADAPEWLRHQRLARDVFRDARRARRRPLTVEQRALGHALGVG